MEAKQTFGNNVIVKMDPSNNFVKTKSGMKLYVDTSFEPEKHVVRIGTVMKVPDKIIDKNAPWLTNVELKEGDRVVMYFLAVQNCMAPEKKNYWVEGKTVFIAIRYQNIYAIIEEGDVKPVNGYIFVEAVEDPEWIRLKEIFEGRGMEMPDLRKSSNTNVTYGKVIYMGKPNGEYKDDYKTDEGHDEKVGDTVVMKRIRDIPVEYEYHAKIDGGRKLYRIQRHDILAIL